MAYVYKHIRKDNNQPFYIGVGGLLSFDNYKRALCNNWVGLRNRSQYWYNVVNKCGFEVEIVLDNCTVEKAFSKEIELISFYGRSDIHTGILVNHTSGGEGNHNLPKESRKRMAYWTGKTKSEETKALLKKIQEERRQYLKEKGIKMPSKQRINKKKSIVKRIPWNKGKFWSEEMKQKLKECAKNRIESEESKINRAKKVREFLTGRPKTIEHIHNMGTDLIDINTKIVYPTIKEAAIAININYGTLKSYLIGKAKNKTNLRYLHEQ